MTTDQDMRVRFLHRVPRLGLSSAGSGPAKPALVGSTPTQASNLICALNSAGRVLALQARCRRFEPVSAHQGSERNWFISITCYGKLVKLLSRQYLVRHFPPLESNRFSHSIARNVWER